MKALTSPDLSKGEEKELKNIVWSSESPPLGDLGGQDRKVNRRRFNKLK